MRIYLHGVFELFHCGHVDILEGIRNEYGPDATIIVGICPDTVSSTVLNQTERVRTISACRYVDVILEEVPWVPDQEFLDKHQIDLVTHSGDTMDGEPYSYVKSIGKFRETVSAMSTEEIKQRIIYQNELLADPYWALRRVKTAVL